MLIGGLEGGDAHSARILAFTCLYFTVGGSSGTSKQRVSIKLQVPTLIY